MAKGVNIVYPAAESAAESLSPGRVSIYVETDSPIIFEPNL
jgi:hypothetical protein